MHYVYCTLRLYIPCFQTTTELRSKYSTYLDNNGYIQSPMKTNGFDAIWAAAKALNASIEHLYPNETLDQFSYGNERMARLLFASLTKLQFEGASVCYCCESFGFGRGVRGPPGIFQKPILQMVQSQLFLSYICEYN